MTAKTVPAKAQKRAAALEAKAAKAKLPRQEVKQPPGKRREVLVAII
tara:strand:- start:131 stop:271 length:141 start_codon:yes stop_codon:yes gene_type:complete